MLLLCLIIGALGFLGAKNIAYYLALTKPVHGRYLVVEGWLKQPELDQALKVFSQANGQYKYLLTTGGPDKRFSNASNLSYAEQSAQYFISKGFARENLIVIPTPESAQARTFLSAVMVRDWFDENPHTETISIDVFTATVHARRTYLLYEMALRSTIDIGIYASTPTDFGLSHWWETSAGAKSVIMELLSLIWTVCFFDPGESGSYQEKWGIRKEVAG